MNANFVIPRQRQETTETRNVSEVFFSRETRHFEFIASSSNSILEVKFDSSSGESFASFWLPLKDFGTSKEQNRIHFFSTRNLCVIFVLKTLPAS